MASKVLTVDFATAQGIQIALSAKSPKGNQQVFDSVDAQDALAPWYYEVPSEDPKSDAVRMTVAPGARDVKRDLVLEGSVFNYIKDAVDDAINGGKLGHGGARSMRSALNAIKAATDHAVKPTLVPKSESA